MHYSKRVSCIYQTSRNARKGIAQSPSLRRYSTASSRDRPLHLAIIGSGPGGYYTAYRLQRRLPNARIDMYEQLPVPFGLVRFGVAPDHPEVKKSLEALETVAESPNFHFAGNVPVGNGKGQLPLLSLAPHYDALLFAYGASEDRTLDVPGEHLQGVISARAFVGWYNGLPGYADIHPNLEAGDTAVIIGQGNVALDVARFLLSPLDRLRETDVSEHALDTLSRSKIRDVKIIGRRGPLQAPYTIKELRELMHLPTVGFVPPPEHWDDLMQVERKTLPRQLKRIAEVLEKGSKTPMQDAAKAWQLGYMRSPAEFLASDGQNLDAVAFEQTEYAQSIPSVMTSEPQADLNAVRRVKVQPTGRKTMLRTSLAFRSVGYRSRPIPGFHDLGIPFDDRLGIIPSDMHGRILFPALGPAGPLTAEHVPGMYCAGWVKRGPTGVIASTMNEAFHTADIIASDWGQGVMFHGGKGDVKGGFHAVETEMREKGIRAVSWRDWQRIDEEEKRRGSMRGKPREKCKSQEEMLAILDS